MIFLILLLLFLLTLWLHLASQPLLVLASVLLILALTANFQLLQQIFSKILLQLSDHTAVAQKIQFVGCIL